MTLTDSRIDQADPTVVRRPHRWWMIGALSVLALLVLGAIAFAVFEPIQVLPRVRLGPGFVLTAQDGSSVTSEDLRGSVVVYNFTYGNCLEPCPSLEDTMAEVQSRLDEADLGDTPVRLVTLSFDPERDTPQVLAQRATAHGADGEQWMYATAAPERIRSIVTSGFGTYFQERTDGTFAFDPAIVIVDGWGVVRGEYRYQTLASDADRVIRHLDILGEEIRNSKGAAGLAYEAAHFFLCYP